MNKYMTNKEVYTIADAAQSVKSGDGVWVVGGSEHIDAFLDALIERAPELKNVTIVTDTADTAEKIGNIKYHGSFNVISGIAEAITQTYRTGDRLEFVKSTAKSAVQILCRDFSINTLVAEVLPPNGDGMCELGHFARAITTSVIDYEGLTNKIAILDENLKTTYKGALKVQLPISGFNMVCRDMSEARVASIA